MSGDLKLLQMIASNTLRKIPGGETVEVKSLWANNTVVIYFLRRFGCPICMYLARQLSKVKPILDKHEVKLVGIGPEALGSEQFYDDKHFDGDLYYDPDKKSYKDMEYRRYNMFNVLGGALSSKSREIANLANKQGIKGNFSGDLMQTGGLLIVKKGGEEILLNFKQDGAADHVENQNILDVLGIKEKLDVNTESGPTCNEDACTL